MTEYDYSPEALDAFIQKQRKIAHWVDNTKRQPLPPIPFASGSHIVSRSTTKENDFSVLGNAAQATSHRLDSPKFTTIEERPFLVPITKVDTIRAIQKLDEQLLQVGFLGFMYFVVLTELGRTTPASVQQDTHKMDRENSRSWPNRSRKSWVSLLD